MWPYVDSAELRLLTQELTAEWILPLDACHPCSRRTPDAFDDPRSCTRRTAGGSSADATSSATATHVQAVRLAAIVANSGRAAATTQASCPPPVRRRAGCSLGSGAVNLEANSSVLQLAQFGTHARQPPASFFRPTPNGLTDATVPLHRLTRELTAPRPRPRPPDSCPRSRCASDRDR